MGPELGVSRFQIQHPNHATTLPPRLDYPLHLLQLRKCQNVKYSGILPSKKFSRGLKTPFALKLLNCYTWLKTEVRRNRLFDYVVTVNCVTFSEVHVHLKQLLQ